MAGVVQLQDTAGLTFNLDSLNERRQLAIKCWGGEESLRGAVMLGDSNHELRALFETLTRNTYRAAPDVEAYEEKRAI
eukprot:2941635-Pleurochrysis_carterae.AAC.1